MRSYVIAVILACLPFCGGVAWADPSANEQGAIEARDTLEALFIESGSLESVARQGFETSGRQIWQGWSAAAGFSELDAAKREAIHVYLVTSYPTEATVDVVQNAPPVLDAFAGRLANRFNREQLADISAFVRSDEGRSWFVNATSQSEREYTPTQAERRAIDRFEQTAGGRAMGSPEMQQFIADVSEQFIVTRALPIRRTLMARVCDILGSDCPPGFTDVQ